MTGANGFLGSWICRVLGTRNEMIAMIRPNSLDFRLGGSESIRIVRGEDDDFNNIVNVHSPEVIVLCDWWGVENDFRHDPRQFSNVDRLSRRISSLNAARTVIGMGSQAEIGQRSKPIAEDILDAPTTLYGKAKVEDREMLERNLNSDVRFVWGRIFSTYGPLDSNSWFIPGTINKILHRQKVALTWGEQEWSFLHAFDLGLALQTIILTDEISGVVNLGNPNTITISEVARFIGNYMGASELLDFGALPYREDQVMRLAPETRKLAEAGWHPQVEIWNGVSSLIDWMSGERHFELNLSNGKTFHFHLPIYDSKK